MPTVATRPRRPRPALERLHLARRELPDGLAWSLLVYAISRVPVVVGLGAFWARNPRDDYRTTALRQDGWWYVLLAQHGYSRSLRPPVTRSAVVPRPRTVLGILPGFVWLAAWLPRRLLHVVCGLLLVATPFVVYLWSWQVTP